MKKLIFTLICFLYITPATAAPFTYSQKEAAYFAMLKAVVDYKMEDEEIRQDLEKLRRNKKFNTWLTKKLDDISNQKNKTGKDKNIYNILFDAGAQIYSQLN